MVPFTIGAGDVVAIRVKHVGTIVSPGMVVGFPGVLVNSKGSTRFYLRGADADGGKYFILHQCCHIQAGDLLGDQPQHQVTDV